MSRVTWRSGPGLGFLGPEAPAEDCVERLHGSREQGTKNLPSDTDDKTDAEGSHTKDSEGIEIIPIVKLWCKCSVTSRIPPPPPAHWPGYVDPNSPKPNGLGAKQPSGQMP